MKRVLVFYGYFDLWHDIYDKNPLMKYLYDIIDDIVLFKNMDELRNYLKTDGQNYKNYILPSRIHHIHDLNNADIKSLFKIDSGWLSQLEDKKLFANYMEKHNLNKFLPKIYTKTGERNSDQTVIVKPRDSCFSYGIYKKKLCELKDCEFDENVVQEYIYGFKEYDAVIVANKGKITLAFAYVSTFDSNNYIKFDKGKPNMKSIKKIMLNDKIISVFERILKPCSYTGTCCFDFKVENKKMYVFEMNPRINGALKSPWNKDNLAEVIRDLIKNYDGNKS